MRHTGRATLGSTLLQIAAYMANAILARLALLLFTLVDRGRASANSCCSVFVARAFPAKGLLIAASALAGVGRVAVAQAGSKPTLAIYPFGMAAAVRASFGVGIARASEVNVLEGVRETGLYTLLNATQDSLLQRKIDAAATLSQFEGTTQLRWNARESPQFLLTGYIVSASTAPMGLRATKYRASITAMVQLFDVQSGALVVQRELVGTNGLSDAGSCTGFAHARLVCEAMVSATVDESPESAIIRATTKLSDGARVLVEEFARAERFLGGEIVLDALPEEQDFPPGGVVLDVAADIVTTSRLVVTALSAANVRTGTSNSGGQARIITYWIPEGPIEGLRRQRWVATLVRLRPSGRQTCTIAEVTWRSASKGDNERRASFSERDISYQPRLLETIRSTISGVPCRK